MPSKLIPLTIGSSLLFTSLSWGQHDSSHLEVDHFNLPEFDVAQLSYLKTGGMDIDGTNGDMEISELHMRSLLSGPVEIFDGLTFIPMFTYSLTSLDFSNTAGFPIQDEDLHSIALHGFLYKEFQNSKWFGLGWGRSEFASDFQDVSGDALTFDAAAGLGYRFSDTFSLSFGIVATDLNGDESIYPGINFDWAVSDCLQIGLYGPDFLATYKVNDVWNLSLRASTVGGSWNVDDQFGNSRTIDLDSYNVGLYTEHNLAGELWLRAGVGFTFANEIEIRDNDGGSGFSREADGAPYAEIALGLRKW